MSTSSNGEGASSWAEMMHNYHQSKFNLPWKPEEREKVRYVSRYDMSRKEREFDPVLQSYRDPEREQRYAQHEQKTKIINLNKAKSKHVLQGQCFDIVNHEWKLETMAKGNIKERAIMPETRAGYNIINNQSLQGYHGGDSDGVSNGDHGANTSSNASSRARVSAGGEFNIISNRYTDHHEERSKLDAKVTKEAAAKRFWATHEFDPILCQYYDADKESHFQARSQMQREQWKKRAEESRERMPPCIRNSEGSYYNIVSIKPKDNERIKELDFKSDTSQSARCMRNRVENAQRRAALATKARDDARFINRTTHEQQLRTYGYQNGFNIVNHRPFQGRGAQPIPEIRQPLKPSLWQRMEQSEQHAAMSSRANLNRNQRDSV